MFLLVIYSGPKTEEHGQKIHSDEGGGRRKDCEVEAAL